MLDAVGHRCRQILQELRCLHVEVADRILSTALLLRLVAFDLRQAADAVPLQTAMQAGAGQARDGRLQAIKAVVQRQQGVAPKGNDDGLLLRRQNRRARLLRPPHGGIGRDLPIAPLLHGGWAD